MQCIEVVGSGEQGGQGTRCRFRLPGDQLQRVVSIKSWAPDQRHELIVRVSCPCKQIGAVNAYALSQPAYRFLSG
ncbi:hypothetical protein D3C71_1694310 [compost metagenome]